MLKKFLSVISLSSLLVLTSIVGSNSHAVAAQDNKIVFESIDVEDLDKHPDVEQFIIENGFEEYVEEGKKSYDELAELYDLEGLYEPQSVEGMDPETEERIRKKYNIPRPDPVVKEYDQQIIVQRNVSTNSIDGAIMFNLIVGNSGANLYLIHLHAGIDPIDNITGTITKYNASGTRWREDDSKSFSKSNVRSGLLQSWSEGKNAVSDYFEFEVTITDAGVTYYKDGGGKDQEYQRYNFQTGRYKDISALGGQRHHFISATPLRNAGFNPDYAPSIRMLTEDHYETPSYGRPGDSHRKKEEELLKQQRYQALIDFNVEALRDAEDSEGYYDNLLEKYDTYVIEAAWLSEAYLGMDN